MSGRYCLGCLALDIGHKREPEPPESITGIICIILHILQGNQSIGF